MSDLHSVDWSKIPAPEDDGAARHLVGCDLPPLALAASDGTEVELASLRGLTVLYAYPMTGRPGEDLPEGWDMIPGARGCTPQACTFRDHFAELRSLGVEHLFGLSTQDQEYQLEAANRLHLPFPLLSDHELLLASSLPLPTFEAAGMRLMKRLTLVIQNGRILHVFYPVFPPDRSAQDVIDWLNSRHAP